MECSLLALIACFSWSNLYIDAQAAYQDSTVPYHYWKDVSPPQNGSVRETAFVSTIGRESQNPYLRNAIGYQISFKRVDLSAEFFHDSSMASDNDHGVNGFGIRARWYPFK